MRRVSSSGIGNLLLTNTKIMLISILSREITKVFVIGIQNKINLNKRYAEEKKDVARKRKMLLENHLNEKETSRKSISPNPSQCFTHLAN